MLIIYEKSKVCIFLRFITEEELDLPSNCNVSKVHPKSDFSLFRVLLGKVQAVVFGHQAGECGCSS